MSAPISRPSGRFFFCSLGPDDLNFHGVIDVEGSSAALAVEESHSTATLPSNKGGDSEADLFGDREFSAAMATDNCPLTLVPCPLPSVTEVDDEDLFGDKESAVAITAGYRAPTPVPSFLPSATDVDNDEDLFGDMELDVAIAAGCHPPTLGVESSPLSTIPFDTDKLSQDIYSAKDAPANRPVAPDPAPALAGESLSANFPTTSANKAEAGRVRQAADAKAHALAEAQLEAHVAVEAQARLAAGTSAPVAARQPINFPRRKSVPRYNPPTTVVQPRLFLSTKNSSRKVPGLTPAAWKPPREVPRRNPPSAAPWSPLQPPPPPMAAVKAPRFPVATRQTRPTVPRVPIRQPIPTSCLTTAVRVPPHPAVAARQPAPSAPPTFAPVSAPDTNLSPPVFQVPLPFPAPQRTAPKAPPRPPVIARQPPLATAAAPARKARHPTPVSPFVPRVPAWAQGLPRPPFVAQQPPSVMVAPVRFPRAAIRGSRPPPRPATTFPFAPPQPRAVNRKRRMPSAQDLPRWSCPSSGGADSGEYQSAKRQATLGKVRSGGVAVVDLGD